VAVLVALGGGLFWAERPAESRATNTLVVLPDVQNSQVASYYDTLSSGQIATTFAQILALRGEAPSAKSQNVTIDVQVVPATSLIQVTATAPDARTAEAAADAALARTRPFFDELSSPYAVFEVQSARGTAQRSGLAPQLLAAGVAAVAIIAGVAVALAVIALQKARESSRRQTEGDAEPLATAAGSSAVQPARAAHANGGEGPAVSGGRSLAAADPRPPGPAR
jgi:capsular polysaccharide biosynthesis protein